MYYIDDIDEATKSNLLQLVKHTIASFHEIIFVAHNQSTRRIEDCTSVGYVVLRRVKMGKYIVHDGVRIQGTIM